MTGGVEDSVYVPEKTLPSRSPRPHLDKKLLLSSEDKYRMNSSISSSFQPSAGHLHWWMLSDGCDMISGRRCRFTG